MTAQDQRRLALASYKRNAAEAGHYKAMAELAANVEDRAWATAQYLRFHAAAERFWQLATARDWPARA